MNKTYPEKFGFLWQTPGGVLSPVCDTCGQHLTRNPDDALDPNPLEDACPNCGVDLTTQI
jgi:hypothetical protein